MRRFLASLFLVVFAGTASTVSARPLVVRDLFARYVGISDPQFSPDGASVVVVVTRADFAHDRYERELDLVDVASGRIRPLTFEREGLGSPRWSPSGDRLAFVAAGGNGDKHGQLWVMPLAGGDARRITHAPEGIEQFAWRPDGSALAYAAADAAPKKHGADEHADLFEIGNDDLYIGERPQPSHLWLVAADGSNVRRLTSGTWSVPVAYPPSPPAAPLSWSADGSHLLYARVPDADDGDAYKSSLYTLDVASGRSERATGHDAFEGLGLYGAAGDRFAYLYPRDGDPNNEQDLVLHGPSGDRVLTHALDRNIFRAIWMPGDDALLVSGNDLERAGMWMQPLDGPPKRVDTGDVSPQEGYWLDASVSHAGAIAFVGSTPAHPPELYLMSSADAAPKALTHLNTAFDDVPLASAKVVTWTNDGFTENGVLWTPAGTQPGAKLPLLLFVHGGPTGASLLSFDRFAQAFAAHGYAVFEPNYRGSDHAGNAYMRAIFNDAGAGPGRDVMAGVAAVEKLGGVDTSRIAVSGWSYGGYMTSWLIGHYHIWKTAISGAAVNNLIDEYDLSDGNIEGRYNFPGFRSPYQGDAMHAYLEQSPITYARDVRTPTLILSDLMDARVPVTQSFAFYHALKDNGVPVEFRAWPIPGHNPADPVRGLQRVEVWNDWLDRHVK